MVITADKSQKRMALGKGFSSLMGLDNDEEFGDDSSNLNERGQGTKTNLKDTQNQNPDLDKKKVGFGATKDIDDYMERAYGIAVPKHTAKNDLKVVDSIIKIKVQEIEPNPTQPRKVFDESALNDLANSIKEDGVIQPIIVSRSNNKNFKYTLVAGERRWRASKLAGLDEIPAIIKETSPMSSLRLALIENIQRQDLSVIEEAQAYKSLIEDFGLTQEQCAQKVGKDRTSITNSLRLLTLPREIQDDIIEEHISMGHGKALLSLDSTQNMLRARDIIVKKQLNVRKAEQLCKKIKVQGGLSQSEEDTEQNNTQPIKQSPDINYIEESLRGYLKTRVKLIGNEKKGKIQISYFSPAELERILSLIGGEV